MRAAERSRGGSPKVPETSPGRSPKVASACPAFAEGCPYARDNGVLDWIKEKRPTAMDNCPAFELGCPFQEVSDMGSLYQALQKLPPSHAGTAEQDKSGDNDKENSAHQTLVGMLQAVHQASQSAKENVGGDCPVFQKQCPFKHCVTSNGTPLVLELETRSWGFLIQETEGEHNLDMQPQHAEEIDEGLATRLKVGTADAHKEAETVNFVREFIKGKVSREIYAQLVVNLYHVYGALEEALEACADHELVDPIHFPDELERTQSLKKDAEFFCGLDWESKMHPSPVTLEYVQRIREVARDNPELIVPHAYTRYLGDLSGGQVLRKAAIRGLKLPDDGSGVCFYIFKRVRDMKVFKNMYRARLDTLDASKTVVDSMVEEANRAFDFNTRIFRELDALGGFAPDPNPPAPSPSAAQEPRPEVSKNFANCPFAALAAQGIPMPAEHPPLDSHNADDVPAISKGTSKEVAGNTQRHGGMALILTASVVVIIAWLSAQVWRGEF